MELFVIWDIQEVDGQNSVMGLKHKVATPILIVSQKSCCEDCKQMH